VEIYYQGYDITDMVTVNTCIGRDTCGDRCDSLEIEFTNAAGWYSWGPKEDDQIVVAHNGYDTGIQYVHTILPSEGTYRILAASLPGTARKKEYRSFTGKTIEEIISMCAARTGMDYQIFGMDGRIIIPYIEQNNESAPAFLQRFLSLEGASLKIVNGKYTAIDIQYAQERTVRQEIEISSNQEGTTYTRNSAGIKRITIRTPYAEADAEDTAEVGTREIVVNYLPARDNIQAGRWARGKLLANNRKCEILNMQQDFNAGMSAFTRIDISGDTDASGEWIVEDVQHDFVNKKTQTRLHRCIWSIQ
jgi:hypothetical protein